jgi:hypothetical protein
MNKKLLHFPANYARRFYIILSASALSIGGVIYIFLRPSEHVFFGWIRAVGLDNLFNAARSTSLSQSLPFPEWFVFSLPNGLWSFAYALLITVIWSGSKSWLRYPWMASIPILVLGYEVLQYTGIIPGTFCIQDLAFGVAGLILGNIVGNKIIKSNNHEKAFE